MIALGNEWLAAGLGVALSTDNKVKYTVAYRDACAVATLESLVFVMFVAHLMSCLKPHFKHVSWPSAHALMERVYNYCFLPVLVIVRFRGIWIRCCM